MLETAVIAMIAVQDFADEKELARFLTPAVFEGLWEDGAQKDVVDALAKDNFKIFVAKCPICMPVLHACRMLAAAPPPPMYDARGPGLPPEIVAQLKAVDLPTRKKGLEALVKRYVDRRFERLKMSDVEKARLLRLIEDGRKKGARYMNPAPGDFCPSCEGAAKAGKP